MAKALHPETRDVRPRALLMFGASLLIFLALAAIALKLIFNTTPYWPLANTGTGDAGPQLQSSPATDLTAFREQEDQELGKLGWVDRSAGIARIPINDAMNLIAAGGLPDWTGQAVSIGQYCALLRRHIPRAPQVGKCGTAAGKALPHDAAHPQDHVTPGTRP